MRRIQKFLCCQEINESIVRKSEDKGSENVVEISQGACFHWGIKPEDEEKSKKDAEKGHKKVLKERKNEKNLKESEQKLIQSDSTAQGGSSESAQESQTLANFVALRDINLNIKRGEFVCIIGDVGSGKSSLLSSLIGDLLYLPYDTMHSNQNMILNKEKWLQEHIHREANVDVSSNSPIAVMDTISYVQQVPWIQNKTIKENITFGFPFD